MRQSRTAESQYSPGKFLDLDLEASLTDEVLVRPLEARESERLKDWARWESEGGSVMGPD